MEQSRRVLEIRNESPRWDGTDVCRLTVLTIQVLYYFKYSLLRRSLLY